MLRCITFKRRGQIVIKRRHFRFSAWVFHCWRTVRRYSIYDFIYFDQAHDFYFGISLAILPIIKLCISIGCSCPSLKLYLPVSCAHECCLRYVCNIIRISQFSQITYVTQSVVVGASGRSRGWSRPPSAACLCVCNNNGDGPSRIL